MRWPGGELPFAAVVVVGVLLVLAAAGGAEARRHHRHGSPQKAGHGGEGPGLTAGRDTEERRQQEEEEEEPSWPVNLDVVSTHHHKHHQLKQHPWSQQQQEELVEQKEEGRARSTPVGSQVQLSHREHTSGRREEEEDRDEEEEEDVEEEEARWARKHSHQGYKHHKGHGKKHHPVEESSDTVYKDQWKRITNYHKSEGDQCSMLKCRRRQICLLNVDTGEAECVQRRLLRMKRKMKKGQGHGKGDKKGGKSKGDKWMKEHAERVRNSPRYQERLEMMYQDQPKSAYDYVDRRASKKAPAHARKVNSVLSVKPKKECTKRDMDEMGRRLLDWFKLLMEEDARENSKHNAHHKTKRNSRKKELREDDECICQAPVSWEFQQLDMDYDNQLTALELQDIEDNGYEHCVRPFIDVCDHNHDMQLSQKEWCCCFADILPPCLSAQRRIPTEERNGRMQVLVGAFVPSCDEDGFFERQQCHSSTGQCWCVDRNGHEISDTRKQGTADCSKYTERYIQDNI